METITFQLSELRISTPYEFLTDFNHDYDNYNYNYLFLLDAVPNNDEEPKGADLTVDVGPGSADCLALHKKGLYIAGQVQSSFDQTSSSCLKTI